MARLIDADRLLRDPYFQEDRYPCSHLIRMAIGEQRTVDAVSRGAHDQVRWERDIAMEQLKEHGIPFGGIAPDVVKVVRCENCQYWNPRYETMGMCMKHNSIVTFTKPDFFCAWGKDKNDGICKKG